MTYAELKTEIDKELLENSDRPGSEDFKEACISSLSIELQDSIDYFKHKSEVVYTDADLTKVGYSYSMDYPAVSGVDDLSIVEVNHVRPLDDSDADQVYKMHRIGWNKRNHIDAQYYGATKVYTFSEDYSTVIVYPEIEEDDLIKVSVRGVKYDFDDADEVPFERSDVRIFGFYIMHRYAMSVSHEMGEADRYFEKYKRAKNSRRSSLKRRYNTAE